MTVTDKERIIIETKLEVYKEVEKKIEEILEGSIDVLFEYENDLFLTIQSLESKISEMEDGKALPEYGPGDEVSHTITDTPMMFTVMEVSHKDKSYKLKSKNQIKAITVVVSWGELNEY